MDLSADLFTTVIEALVGGRSPWANERRTVPRVGLSGVVRVTFVQQGRLGMSEPAKVRDVSARGIGLLYNANVRVGDQFYVELSRRNDKPMTLLCAVQHCRKVDDHLFRLGAKFLGCAEGAPAEVAESLKNSAGA